MEESIIDWSARIRADLDKVGVDIKRMKNTGGLTNPSAGADVGEAFANIMLAYRHVEDARMRLGKVVQAMDGGVSCYPR